MTARSTFASWMQQRQTRIEQVLSDRLPDNATLTSKTSTQLVSAMRYSILNGGKRLRALLTYATGETLNVDLTRLDLPASAVEMMHAYSLVHDDMPIMDNDDLRRGRPTCHKAYDDATALLVGDALQTLAFETLCDDRLSPLQQSKLVKTLANQSGVMGMVGGQSIDLESVGSTLSLEDLQTMHELKTGSLIRASVKLGALLSPQVDENTFVKLDNYAHYIGLAFQIQDDVLDVMTDTNMLGKTQGADMTLNKPTYPALLGLPSAQQKAITLTDKALAEIDTLPYDTYVLAALANFIVQRTH